MKITKWIRTGTHDMADIHDTDVLMDTAGRAMDKAYTHEIMGEVVFEAEDGKTYVGIVTFTLDEINPEYLKMLQDEDAEEVTS